MTTTKRLLVAGGAAVALVAGYGAGCALAEADTSPTRDSAACADTQAGIGEQVLTDQGGVVAL